MSNLSDFMKSLTETERDSALLVVNDLLDSSAPERLDSLSNFISTVTREIETINRKRDAIGQKIQNLEVLLPKIERYLSLNPKSTEVILTKNFLVSWKTMLKAEVAESRPDVKLTKKYDAERRREVLNQVYSVAMELSSYLKERKS